MGNYLNRTGDGAPPSPPSTHTPSHLTTPRGQRKRPRDREAAGEDIEEISPRRKQIRTTSTYIYETLFRKGVNSDLTISALGREWKLHKHYLCQSGYFNSMFSGNWRESSEAHVRLDIPDPHITLNALDIAFSSLYRDEVCFQKTEICAIIAAASMLQMEGLLEHCKVFMKETLSPECVIVYLSASSLYGLQDIEKECRQWLQLHLVKSENTTLLKEISCDLLTEFVKSADLFVMQVEMDVYTLAKRWLFLKLHPDWLREFSKLLKDAEKFFKEKSSEDDLFFLEREEGMPYLELFRAIRLQHILNDPISIQTLEADKIVPDSWLHPVYRDQWLTMLRVDQRKDPGPSALTSEEFNAMSFRCGRVLHQPGDYCWRWTGYSFGFDLLILYDTDSGSIAVKRNTTAQPCVSAVSLQQKRILAIRFRIASLDDSGRMSFFQDTGIVQLGLMKDEECPLLKLDCPVKFPQYISVNMALTAADVGAPQNEDD